MGKRIFWQTQPIVRSRSRSEPGVFGSLEPEPEPLEKKTGAGAGAAWEKIRSRSRLKKKSGAGAGAGKKFAGSPALVFTVRCGALVVQEKKYFLGIHGVYLS